jgi:hypothetical protein
VREREEKERQIDRKQERLEESEKKRGEGARKIERQKAKEYGRK